MWLSPSLSWIYTHVHSGIPRKQGGGAPGLEHPPPPPPQNGHQHLFALATISPPPPQCTVAYWRGWGWGGTVHSGVLRRGWGWGVEVSWARAPPPPPKKRPLAFICACHTEDFLVCMPLRVHKTQQLHSVIKFPLSKWTKAWQRTMYGVLKQIGNQYQNTLIRRVK